MPLSMQSKFEEKRFALRMALRLPIVVSGRTEDGAAWSEPTETDDISTLTAGDGNVTFVGQVTVGPDIQATEGLNNFGTWIFRNTGTNTWVGYRKG